MTIAALHLDRILADFASLAAIVYSSFMARNFRKDVAQRKEQEQHFEDVLKGVEKAPGIEARPSLVERLGGVEAAYAKLDRKTDDQNKVLVQILTEVGKIDKLNGAFITHLENHAAKPATRTPPPRRRSQS